MSPVDVSARDGRDPHEELLSDVSNGDAPDILLGACDGRTSESPLSDNNALANASTNVRFRAPSWPSGVNTTDRPV